MRRLLSVAPALLAVACLVVLPACGKKAPPANPGPVSGPGGDSGPSGPAVTSEFAVFAQVNAKDVFASELFAEILKSAGAGDAAKMKADLEKQGQAALGVKPTDLASAAIYVTDIPEDPALGGRGPGAQRGGPRFVAVLTANAAMDKAALLKSLGGASEPDARGFHAGNMPALAHFADDKTVALVHPDLANQYLAGFGKDRAGWPVSADLTAAAAGHALYAQVQMDKLPASVRNAPEAQGFAALLAAKSGTLTLDLKGKTLALNARMAYPDATAADNAKKLAAPFLGFASMTVDGAATGQGAANLGSALPAVKAAQKALKEAKLETAGSDLTLAVNYTADFDIGAILADATKKVGAASERMKAANNFKQIALGLHIFHDSNGSLPVHAIGKGGKALKAGDKPLLSWRVAILPYIEQDNLYKQFKLDEAWDSEHNKKLIPMMPKVFAPAPGKPAKPGHTHVQMAVGVAGLNPVGTRIPASFTDGTSNTVAFAEAAEAVEWTKPADIMLAAKATDLKKKFGGQFPGGFLVAMWDASVKFVPNTVTERTLGAALTPNGGEVLGGDW